MILLGLSGETRLLEQFSLLSLEPKSKLITLLQACNSIHKFDIICLSETHLYSSYQSDNDQLALPGYNLIRAGNQNNIKRGGICI